MALFSRDSNDTRTAREVREDIRRDLGHRMWCGDHDHVKEHGQGRNGEQGGEHGRRR